MREPLKLHFESPVQAAFEKVVSGFNVDLFRALCPPFPRVKILRFDGIEEGNLIELRLNFILFQWRWFGKIISFQKSTDKLSFVDAGTKLPPFLTFWEHTHTVLRSERTSIIRDEICFLPAGGWPVFLVKWMIILQMQPRKRIYQEFFTR